MKQSTFVSEILAGNRRRLAKAITLIESTKEEHRTEAQKLLREMSHLPSKAIRIGISGIPGVGKSTLIGNLAREFISDTQQNPNFSDTQQNPNFSDTQQKHRKNIAILTIDPTSPVHGGSILADKTRMSGLVAHPHVFIRPSPTRGSHGGTSRRTWETLYLLERVFDYVLIETVGVGQNEYEVSNMVDVFVLLQMPATGDEWQVVKRGINELADIMVINKADGDLKGPASALAKTFTPSMALRPIKTKPILCSQVEHTGIAELAASIEAFVAKAKEKDVFAGRRQKQAREWLAREILCQFEERLSKPPFSGIVDAYKRGIEKSEALPFDAAQRAVRDLLSL